MWIWNKKIVVTDHARVQYNKRRHLLKDKRKLGLYKLAHTSARSCSLKHTDTQGFNILRNLSKDSDQFYSYYNSLIFVYSKNEDGSIALVTVMPFGRI